VTVVSDTDEETSSTSHKTPQKLSKQAKHLGKGKKSSTTPDPLEEGFLTLIKANVEENKGVRPFCIF
jgi:hypothetical protein